MRRIVVLALVALLAMAAFAPAASAEAATYDLTVKHRNTGEPLANQLGLPVDRDLAVDEYVNGGYAFTFELGDTIKTELPAGEYDIVVKVAEGPLAGTPVLSLMDAEIPAGANVEIIAKRTGKLTADLGGIGLKVKVK